MARRRKIKINDPFIREESFTTEEGKTIVKGDIIKIKGVWGIKFKFLSHVTNPKNNVSWIDCIQLEKGIGCGWRSFYPDRVKTIPKRRGKRVKGAG
jgi:hypothetical protein